MSLCTDLRNARFVFWPYAQYPYTLGAMAMPRPNGMWYVPTYQMTVKPLAVHTMTVGKGINQELKELTKRYDEALRALKDEFLTRAIEAAPFVEIP